MHTVTAQTRNEQATDIPFLFFFLSLEAAEWFGGELMAATRNQKQRLNEETYMRDMWQIRCNKKERTGLQGEQTPA